MSRFEILLEGYTSSTLNETELQEFLTLLPSNQSYLKDKILNDLTAKEFDGLTNAEQISQIFNKIIEKKNAAKSPVAKVIFLTWQRWVAVAAVVLCLIGLWYIYPANKTATPIIASQKKTVQKEIAAGGNHAILTLADGSTIVLDDAKNGDVTQQGTTKIIKLDSGKLAYINDRQPSDVIVYNTISTPRGGQYEIVLPDGSHVWLNAVSSLNFPTSFSGTNRNVALTGEAYFEVSKNKSMPFIVAIGETKVTVLGTHFNVNAYTDEKNIITTLMEGSVKFSGKDEERLLNPGQQSVYDNTIHSLMVKKADVSQAIAWKDGFFEFSNTDLGTIMRQIARWYDVDISYKTTIKDVAYGGGISRKLNLTEVLRLLETSGVKFKIDNRKITVLDN